MNRKLQFGIRRVVLVMVLVAWGFLPAGGLAQTYTTNFEGEENPLSENGKWSPNGSDWTSIRKKDGLAFSTETGTNHGPAQYDDSNACLSGFPPNQEAWGEVVIAKPDSSCNQEVEILLRWTISEHSTTGYECMGRCISGRSSYLEIVRWEGPLGKFTYLAEQKKGADSGLKNGDILKASAVGNVITLYVNGVEKLRAVDDTFKTGNPGIGAYLHCGSSKGIKSNADFGFKNFTARALTGVAVEEVKPVVKDVVFDGEQKGANAKGWAVPEGRSTIATQTKDERSEGRKTMVFRAKGNEWMGCGWNWFGWDPEDAGTDISKQKNVSFWAKVTGKQKPTELTVGLGASDKTATETADLLTYCPDLMDGAWHEVVVPIKDLDTKNALNKAKVCDIRFGTWSQDDLDFSLLVDEIGFDSRAEKKGR
jgi:hypothetical protein